MPGIFDDVINDGRVFCGQIWKGMPAWIRVAIFIFIIVPATLLTLAAVVHASAKELGLWWFNPTENDNSCIQDGVTFSSTFDPANSCNWIGFDGLISSKTEENIFRPRITGNFLGGRDIFFPVEVSPRFHASIQFVPQNTEKVNVTVNYGYMWRLIIGNGDYNQVIMQRNRNPAKKNLGKHDWVDVPERNGNKWVQRNGRFDSGKEINVDTVSRPRLDKSVIHVSATVSGYVNGKLQKEDFDFDYDVEASGSADSLMERVGIGLLDPFDEGVETKLVGFKLQQL